MVSLMKREKNHPEMIKNIMTPLTYIYLTGTGSRKLYVSHCPTILDVLNSTNKGD